MRLLATHVNESVEEMKTSWEGKADAASMEAAMGGLAKELKSVPRVNPNPNPTVMHC